VRRLFLGSLLDHTTNRNRLAQRILAKGNGALEIAHKRALRCALRIVSMVLRYAHTNVEQHAQSIENLPWGKFGEKKAGKG
jgi:hypothetical protein